MSLSDLSNLGSFVSGVAVLISLAYLSFQIRQNTKHSRALIQQGRAGRISEAALHFADLAGEPGIVKCFDGDADITAADLRRFLFMCRAAFVSAEDSWLQHEEGLLSGAGFDAFEASVKGGMGGRGVQLAWALSREGYEPRFRDYMDKTLGTNSHRALPASHVNLARWKAAIGSSQ